MFSLNRPPDLLTLLNSVVAPHLVQFYEDDSIVVDAVSHLVGKTLDAGNSTVLIGSPAHLREIEARLESSKVDLSALRRAQRYTACDAAEMLEQISIDGWPDEGKFTATIGDLVRRAVRSSADGFAFAFGEMVAILGLRGNFEAAVHLERLWNSLAQQSHFSLYCVYPIGAFDRADLKSVSQVCAEHALVLPTEDH